MTIKKTATTSKATATKVTAKTQTAKTQTAKTNEKKYLEAIANMTTAELKNYEDELMDTEQDGMIPHLLDLVVKEIAMRNKVAKKPATKKAVTTAKKAIPAKTTAKPKKAVTTAKKAIPAKTTAKPKKAVEAPAKSYEIDLKAVKAGTTIFLTVEGEDVKNPVEIVKVLKSTMVGYMVNDESNVFNFRKTDLKKGYFKHTDYTGSSYNIQVTLS